LISRHGDSRCIVSQSIMCNVLKVYYSTGRTISLHKTDQRKTVTNYIDVLVKTAIKGSFYFSGSVTPLHY